MSTCTVVRTTSVAADPARVVGRFVNMDKLVGKDFEKGLARLKATAES